MSSLLIRGRRVALPDGLQPAAVLVRDGRIVEVLPRDQPAPADHEIDAGNLVVMPGVVDTHVHINDPGRADWEGFDSATRAAAAGGVTTLVDMPLNSIPATTTAAGLEAKRAAAAGRCHVDVGFWGGVVPGNTSELEPLARADVLGFKCFLSPSGVDEFEHVSETNLREALPILARLRLPLLAHAESPAHLLPCQGDPRQHRNWLTSRPPAAEHAAIDLLIRLAREYGAHIHIVHLASADALASIAAARAEGVPITVETCPHYLTFAAEDIADGATAFKCAPPIRERGHRERLWSALAEGSIDLVATDHSPAPPALKHLEDGDFLAAWGGIASLQLGLSAVWTGAAARGMTVERLTRWLSSAPARLAGLDSRKGRIEAGADADLVVWDPDAEWTVDPAKLFHRHPVTPYAGRRLRGVVTTTVLGGRVVFESGGVSGSPAGRLLVREAGRHDPRYVV
jgi:allantoinase